MKKSINMLTVVGFMLFAFAVFFGYRLATPTDPLNKLEEPLQMSNASSSAYEFKLQEHNAVCYQYHLNCNAQTLNISSEEETKLRGMGYDEIVELYAYPSWSVNNKDGIITLTKLLPGVCAEHKKTLHIGLNETNEYLAVYYGPSVVGSAGGAYLVTDIAVSGFDEMQLERISSGYYELQSQDELIAILDSFSEIH